MGVTRTMSTHEMSEETKERLAELHETVKEKSREGYAYSWGYDNEPLYVYWDDETEQWLVATQKEGLNLFSSDQFPKGFEIGLAWGDERWVDVEDTPLYHGTYGLDRARDGYGSIAG